MSATSIRRAALDDVPHITRLWQKMMEYHRSFDPRFDLVADHERVYQEYLVSVLNNFDYGIFVADDKGTVVGYCIGMILNNPAVFTLERYGFISEMAVEEPYQRKGIGKQLWTHMQRWFHRRGISVMQLNVSPNNEKGTRFWKKMGCDEFLTIMWHNIPKNIN